ncbi:Septum formation initiator [Propionibacterium cyclohexanicum]|uniref:Septum formation initiator n=2 Tax=Propionibacterium cyclohexanicum TaxID=64702 RepID=A0A1H9RJ13_9ACTN|nr:Septum formation initiator [Propionibacterium cyclohexanicum]
MVVLAILVISLVSSLRVYVDQRSEMASARAQIAQSNEQIAALEQQKQQWDDPDFVRAQARDRLGWVMPGESGYRVVDAKGEPYGGGTTIDRTTSGEAANQSWWQRLWSSVRAADQPTATPSVPAGDRIISVSPSPEPTPVPSGAATP